MENPHLRLRELMSEKNITGKALAEKLDIRQATISYIITGRQQPRLETLAEIAKALGVEIADLFRNSISGSEPIYVKRDGELVEIGTLKRAHE